MNNRYKVTVEMQTKCMAVYAKNKIEAKQKAYNKLKKNTAFRFVEKGKTDVSQF